MTGFAIYLTLLFVFTYIILNLKDSMVICEGEEEEDDKKKLLKIIKYRIIMHFLIQSSEEPKF